MPKATETETSHSAAVTCLSRAGSQPGDPASDMAFWLVTGRGRGKANASS